MADSSSTSSSKSPSLTRLWPALVVALSLALGDRITTIEFPTSESESRRPFEQINFSIDSRYIAGLSAHTRVETNAQALRGDVLLEGDHKVLLTGGSTSYATLLDENDAPHACLRRGLSSHNVVAQVANAARAGHPLHQLLPELLRLFEDPDMHPDVLVAMFGANEVEQFFNHAPWLYENAAAAQTPQIDPQGPYGRRQWAQTYAGWYRPGNHGRFIVTPRRVYGPATWTEQMHAGHRPRLQSQLNGYASGLEALLRAAALAGVEVMLVTQPIAPMDDEFEEPGRWAPFFFAQPGTGFLPSPRLMTELVEQFNQVTIAAAQRHGIAVLDLAGALRGCGGCFYDQWHFTIEGSERTGRAIAEALAGANAP